MRLAKWSAVATLALFALGHIGCADDERAASHPTDAVNDLAGGCYAVSDADGHYLQASGASYGFSAAGANDAAALRLQPSDLGDYLLYDQSRFYLAAKKVRGAKVNTWSRLRTSQAKDIGIGYYENFSDAEWEIVTPRGKTKPYLLRHLNSRLYLGKQGLGSYEDAARLTFTAHQACVDYPELTLDAHGAVRREPWPNGDVFGFGDAHTHLMTNLGFGGGGVFHGAPFHRLGVEYALGDCDATHGPGGERDVVSYFYGGAQELDPMLLPRVLVTGSLGKFNHATDGYPTFSAWPDPRRIPTHQAQYYRWLERAYMGGLRIIFQHATGNSALCELMVGFGSQEAPYGCNDMTSADLQIDATFALERYVDALAGGPGLGWFRVVTTPTEARAQINQGKLAVVLGIEISNVFDCFLTPPPGMAPCTEEFIQKEVEKYYAKGVRVIFPVHKFDNGFSAGDGSRGVLELGNLINSGHYSDFTLDCPDVSTTFDHGDVQFGGLNRHRDDYFSHAPIDVTRLDEDPTLTFLPILPDLAGGELKGAYCQAHGLTNQGRFLLHELMRRGMMIDVAHMPKRSVVEALDILDANKYPALSTHGSRFNGRIYRHGGTSDANFGRCGDPLHPGRKAAEFLDRAAEIKAANGLPAQPLAFDMNGFAGNPGPRFGPRGCSTSQVNPVTYPFKSYDGGVTFTKPEIGVRALDFNTEGMIHIGLLPEYIEDVRRDGTTAAELEPLFHTAETLLRVWEASEAAAN
jgi:hypothetical protein